MKDSITREDVVNFLNELVTLNQPAIHDLFTHRVDAGNLTDHDRLVVNPDYRFGILGILNGLFVDVAGEEGARLLGTQVPRIAAVFNEDGHLFEFGIIENITV
jgi:hypothetical protein